MEEFIDRSSWGVILANTSISGDAGAVLLAVILAVVAAVIVWLLCQVVSLAQGPLLAALTFIIVLVALLLL